MTQHLSCDCDNPSANDDRNEFEFTLKLRMDCPTELWKAAAVRCMEQSDMTIEEIEEMIGSIDDPSLEDCLMLLLLPGAVPGCTRIGTGTKTLPH